MWPFESDNFDLALDMMVLHALNKDERQNYTKNLFRVLKPGGFLVLYTIASDSPAAQDLFIKRPGTDANTYVIPQSGIIKKAFSRQDLENIFSQFQIKFLKEE